MLTLILIAVAAWVLQTVLGVLQFRRFSRHLRELRTRGRVAIGKAKGRLMSGVIVLFVLDADDTIISGEIMEGRTVFASFSELRGFEGVRLPLLTEEYGEGLGLTRQQLRAVLAARDDLIAYEQKALDLQGTE